MTEGRQAALASRPLRVLVVDDSATNRRLISRALAASPAVEVVGTAADGEEALRFVRALVPDVITLDLEMPRMGGFAFLRILMSQSPTPTVVVSTYSQRDNVFRALELGAMDFVAKPETTSPDDSAAFRAALIEKVTALRGAGPRAALLAPARPQGPQRRSAPGSGPPRHLVGIVASTGGPAALTHLFGALTTSSTAALLVAQHMPERFTRTFARRLDEHSAFAVAEAAGGELVLRQQAFVCPGHRSMELRESAGSYRVALSLPAPTDPYAPSGDRLLESLARAAGRRAVAIILTGMGDDGTRGAAAVREAGGVVIAESEATAVVYGMPGAAVRAGVVSEELPLPSIAEWLGALTG